MSLVWSYESQPRPWVGKIPAATEVEYWLCYLSRFVGFTINLSINSAPKLLVFLVLLYEGLKVGVYVVCPCKLIRFPLSRLISRRGPVVESGLPPLVSN